ncbi:hypothetical protein MLGJGCBP_08186 [Rhodococcus sp. T7]|nr:hypothetical protein MLGJGCBP_08186 [Rhodococcus sp. T7]
MAEVLEGAAAANHHTHPGGTRESGHDRDRCGEEQRARGRDDEDGDRSGRRAAERPRRGGEEEGEWEEPGRDPIGESDYRGGLRGGFSCEPHDTGVGAFLGTRVCLHLEDGAGVDDTGAHGLPYAALNVHGLPRQRCLVEDSESAGDPAVGGDGFAGPDDENVSGTDLVDRHDLDAVPDMAPRGPWGSVEQGAQILGCSPGRGSVEGLTGCQHDGDQGTGEILVHQ